MLMLKPENKPDESGSSEPKQISFGTYGLYIQNNELKDDKRLYRVERNCTVG